MKEATGTTKLMTEGGITRQILIFSIPLILGNLLQQTYNAADSIIVGNYLGSSALAAVGSSTSLIGLLIAFSMGTATGAGVLVSQYLGARDKKGLEASIHTALALAVVLGLVLTAAGVLFTPQILKWMGTPEEVMEQSVTYLRIFSYGLFFNVLYNMAAGILNAVGNSTRSLLYLVVAAVTNIVLDLVFIRNLHMGVEGAAIATDISQVLSSLLAVAFLMRTKEEYRISLSKLRLEKSMTVRIMQIGLPTGIQNMMISFSNVLLQSSVNRFGANAMAGFAAYIKVDGFNILPVTSFSMAATTFTGQNFGAGKMDRVRKGAWVTLWMSIIYTILTGVLLLLFSHQVIGFFTKDQEVIANGILAMRYFCPFYWILAILHSLAGTVRGTGKTIPPMLILLISLCLFRILWIQAVLPHFDSLDGIYVLYPVSWTIGALMMIGYTWKGNWRGSGR